MTKVIWCLEPHCNPDFCLFWRRGGLVQVFLINIMPQVLSVELNLYLVQNIPFNSFWDIESNEEDVFIQNHSRDLLCKAWPFKSDLLLIKDFQVLLWLQLTKWKNSPLPSLNNQPECQCAQSSQNHNSLTQLVKLISVIKQVFFSPKVQMFMGKSNHYLMSQETSSALLILATLFKQTLRQTHSKHCFID